MSPLSIADILQRVRSVDITTDLSPYFEIENIILHMKNCIMQNLSWSLQE
jgi:hypothetical protein